MRVQPFTAEEIGGIKQREGPPTRTPAARRAPRTDRRKQQKQAWKRPSALAVKVGICALACGMMFVMKALDVPAASQMVSGVRSAVEDEQDLTEMLGKLQFVELTDVLAVFSGNERMALPVSAPIVTMGEDAEYAQWEGAPHADVFATAAGEVRAIGEDAVLGPYVRLQHADDLETVYYGLATIQVEQGQPIRKKDTLGTLGEHGTLSFRVLLAGMPQAPSEYLDLVA